MLRHLVRDVRNKLPDRDKTQVSGCRFRDFQTLFYDKLRHKQPNKTAVRVFVSIPVSSGASIIGVPFNVLPFKTISHVDIFLVFISFRYLFILYFSIRCLFVLYFVSLCFYLFRFTHYTIICTINDSH